VEFSSGTLQLTGWLYTPEGDGPFPAILDNHGSEKTPVPDPHGPNKFADHFVSRGYIYFYPERRGHGHSAAAGAYIRDLVNEETKRNGKESGDMLMVRLLETEQISDVLSALKYLRERSNVRKDRVVVMGSSFGGIMALLSTEHEGVAAAIDFAGGAMNWPHNTALRARMLASAARARAPLLLIQAENDFDIGPSRELWAEMTRLGKPCPMRIYPPHGESKQDGHRFIGRG
jgi:dipeptidyl aminopeptidase/acylaminoacyl peptidase